MPPVKVAAQIQRIKRARQVRLDVRRLPVPVVEALLPIPEEEVALLPVPEEEVALLPP